MSPADLADLRAGVLRGFDFVAAGRFEGDFFVLVFVFFLAMACSFARLWHHTPEARVSCLIRAAARWSLPKPAEASRVAASRPSAATASNSHCATCRTSTPRDR